MDVRPPPEVTIEGGPGWQLEGPREALDAEDAAPERSPWWDRHRVGAPVVAAVVGFALATALADLRTTTIEESPEGVLSLDVRLDPQDFSSGTLATDGNGDVAVTTAVVVRNTGPRPVALEDAELVGTPYRSDDLRGRRVADGEQTVVQLLRALDCSRLERTAAPGPLRVRATTGAGLRTVDLRLGTQALQFHDDLVRGACGQNDAEMAVVVLEQQAVLRGSTLVLRVSMSNASARPLSVEALTPAPGLRVAGLVDDDDAPLALPLALEPGDYDPPVDPFQGRGPETEVSVRLEVADCALYRPPTPDVFEPAVTVEVTGGRGFTGFGGDSSALGRLHRVACGEPAVRGGVVVPLSADDAQVAEDAAERRYFALRRDHPFLTPD